MADTQVHNRWNRFSFGRFFQAPTAFIAVLVVAAALATGDGRTARAAESPTRGGVTTLSDHLLVYHGPINVGIVRDGENALLIDCGDGSFAGVLSDHGIVSVKQIVFTHYHRDQACGAHRMAEAGAKVGVPAAEREYFADPGGYWNDDKYLRRLHGSFRPHPLMLTKPLPVDQEYAGSDEFAFGAAKISVVNTPGHTDGAVSYLVEVDGKRVVFSGDCIYDEGQVWDIYSLQEAYLRGNRRISFYHGFMGARWRLAESLGRIKDLRPDVLVPSHGKLMEKPGRAIDALVERLDRCYEKYIAISSLRHWFGESFADYAGRPGQMPFVAGIKPPDCLRHFDTSWMLVSNSGTALVMDVGWPKTVDKIKEMIARGKIVDVEGLWVTHYHYDHVEGVPAFQQQFDCPCFADRRVAEVLKEPSAWRLPALPPEPLRGLRPMEDGQSWRWREFKLTSHFYPGQTRYHGALLVEGRGLRMLFVGDSNAPSGLDDYCAQNRNWLGRGVGFHRCIALIGKLKPTHIFHCHLAEAFTFTPEQVRFMLRSLEEREKLFGELVPWDHANYGMDASWVRCDPYLQKVRPGTRVRLALVVTNHSETPHRVACRVVASKASGDSDTPWVTAEVPAKVEQRLPVVFQVPRDVTPGRHVIVLDVQYGPWNLPQFDEAIIDVATVADDDSAR